MARDDERPAFHAGGGGHGVEDEGRAGDRRGVPAVGGGEQGRGVVDGRLLRQQARRPRGVLRGGPGGDARGVHPRDGAGVRRRARRQELRAEDREGAAPLRRAVLPVGGGHVRDPGLRPVREGGAPEAREAAEGLLDPGAGGRDPRRGPVAAGPALLGVHGVRGPAPRGGVRRRPGKHRGRDYRSREFPIRLVDGRFTMSPRKKKKRRRKSTISPSVLSCSGCWPRFGRSCSFWPSGLFGLFWVRSRLFGCRFPGLPTATRMPSFSASSSWRSFPLSESGFSFRGGGNAGRRNLRRSSPRRRSGKRPKPSGNSRGASAIVFPGRTDRPLSCACA